MRLVFFCFVLFFSLSLWAQDVNPEVVQKTGSVQVENGKATPQVGKHVADNMDAMTMILSLFMVLGLIVGISFVMKRLQPKRSGLAGLKIVTSLHLGTKERLVVVQVAEKQLLLGVTSQQITILDTLKEPLKINEPLTEQLGQSLFALFKK